MSFAMYSSSKVDYGEHDSALKQYQERGTERALAMKNRGPVRYDPDGRLDQNILDEYRRNGFYVFTEVLEEEELVQLRNDVEEIWRRAPQNQNSTTDSQGRPAIGLDCKSRNFSWVRPLSDPIGGTSFAHGRHPVKMIEPEVGEDAPEEILQILLGSLQFSDACLRIYGHPDLLRIAEAINGEDFVPFNESIWVKHPRLGGSVAWHQDGFTHWDSPELDGDTHGFNFMAQLYGCNAANGLWVLPGSHLEGKVDIRKLVDDAKSDRIEGAVPLICEPGDVAICNRQAVHGSFANTSDDIRVTINMGFHRRSSVLNVVGGGIHNDVETYTEERIASRSRLIGYAIDARKQEYPSEDSFVYTPMKEQHFVWDAAARESIRDYNLEDLGI